MHKLAFLFLSVLYFVVSAGSLFAFEPIGGTYRDYVRVLALLGKSDWTPRQMNTYSNFAGALETITTQDHLWADRLPTDPHTSSFARVVDPELRVSANSHLPYNRNNESQWEGRGLNTFMRGGAAFGYKGLSAVFVPELWFAQNLSFETMSSHSSIESEYGDYFAGIDRPQRFGNDPVVELWPGQSSIRYQKWNTSVGFSSENMWLGPASDNAVVMSNNAAGFPRFEIGTAQPANLVVRGVDLGRFEATTWWGALVESDYFDSNSDNDYNFKLGYTLGYVPPFLKNLHLGFNRSYVSPMETVDSFKAFQHFDTFFKQSRWVDFNGEDDITQVASVTAHWFMPAAGFETYFEWARNDHTGSLNDFIDNPEHSQAFVLGFRKVLEFSNFYLALEGELAKLGNNETTTAGSPRPTFPYYRHGPVAQGYTNRGQELGAWIGTGSNSQYIGLKGYFEWGRLDFGFTRHVFDNDYYLERNGETLWPEAAYRGYDVRLITSLGGEVFLGPVDLGLNYTFHRLTRWNWDDDSPELNNTVTVSARYRLN